MVEGLEACGLQPDEHRVSASDPLFVRSLDSWQRAVRSWIDDPTQEKALILVSVLVDSRPVWGVHTGTPVADSFRLAPSNPALLRLLARFALSHRPPTGFFRGLVVEPTGEHRGRLDLKQRGVIADRRPRALGGHGGRRDQRLDDRAAARRRSRRNAVRRPRRARSRTRSR